jgi:S1-C subfamily serine protease
MKGLRILKTLAVLSWLLLPGLCYGEGEDLLATDGKVYSNIRVIGETPETVKILHDGGVSSVQKKHLPAEFLKLHDLAALPSATEATSTGASSQLLAAFVAGNPFFVAKDGRQFSSASIIAVEPSGLKIMSDAGLTRVRFIDLPEAVRTAFAYDPLKAAAFERDVQAQQQKASNFELRKSNAASIVEARPLNLRLYLVQNVGNGWLCAYQELRDQERTVVTSRPGSPLSGPKVVYESQVVRESMVVGSGTAMVFGIAAYHNLPSDLQGRRIWSGRLYTVGRYVYEDTTNGYQDLPCLHIDRAQAIDLVARHGPGKNFAPNGEPEPAVVEAQTVQGTGTCFAITNDGHLATSAHVVEDATSIHVYVGGKPKAARVVALDKTNDLAVIKVDGLQTKGLHLADSADLSLGADLFVVGFPLTELLGTNVKFTKGSLSAIAKDSPDKSVFQMSVPVQPGNSGGPVCNVLGSVCGVVRSVLVGRSVQNVNRAVTSELLKELCLKNSIKIVDAGQISEKPEQHVIQACYLVSVAGTK